MICTPTCPICLKNYSKECRPVVLQPCGHGGCTECIETLQSIHDESNCPICRENIISHRPNYDLREITDSVGMQESYWGRRLMETIQIPGQNICISEDIRKFCKILCYRIAVQFDEKEEMHKFCRIFLRTLRKADTTVDDAFSWLKVFRLPIEVHAYMVEQTLEFYENKYFLEKHDALWIMDAISI